MIKTLILAAALAVGSVPAFAHGPGGHGPGGHGPGGYGGHPGGPGGHFGGPVRFGGGPGGRGFGRGGGRFWGGTWYPYGVGECWIPTPAGYVWACGY